MSILASCQRLPATVPDLANRPRQLVFLTPLDSQLNDFLNEIHQIARFEPSIVERIDEDLDLHAKKKKLLRLADAQFLAGQTPDLPKLQLQLRELKVDDIELETGRPRTDAYIVYLFLMLRGFNGGCKDQHARLLLEESITLRLWLNHLGLELPPASTLSDNLNAVSNQSRGLIEQAQLRFILQQGLDDFQKCFIDSTAVEANVLSGRRVGSSQVTSVVERDARNSLGRAYQIAMRLKMASPYFVRLSRPTRIPERIRRDLGNATQRDRALEELGRFIAAS